MREQPRLLVLDSCEHLIDAVAVMVEHILNGAPELRVLATSREPLRLAGEYVYRLTPVPYPAAGSPLNAEQALAFPAVLLFVLRASECLHGYQLTDADAPTVAEICRRMEGIPLAIELAATRMDALGASGLAARLGEVARSSRLARFQLNQRAAALATLANVLWLQGCPDQAVDTAQAALHEARDARHVESVMYAISNAAFPLMVRIGDHAAAGALLDELSCHLKTHALPLWETTVRCLRATLQVLRGDASALPLLQQAVGQVLEAGYRPHAGSHLGTLAEALGAQDRRAAGLALIGYALASCEAGEERWCQAECCALKERCWKRPITAPPSSSTGKRWKLPSRKGRCPGNCARPPVWRG